MNKNIKVDIKITAITPIAHFGDERYGITVPFRREKTIENETVPVYSGNALRGILRRRLMYDYLERIGVTNEGIIDKLYYLMFSGGTLTSGSRYNEIGERRKLREICPPLSLFGSAIGSQIPQGKTKGYRLSPICKETAPYTGIESNTSCWDLLQIEFQTRKDDLKSANEEIISEETKSDKDNAVQMKYEFETLCTGTVLVGKIIGEAVNDIEISCMAAMLEIFKEMPYLGGKSSAGFGEVRLEYEHFADSDKYYQYIEERKDDMREWIRELEKVL